jgi:malic enzyme
LERYICLIGLADRNETLFYKVLMFDPMCFLPIIYDPTVAKACLKFSDIYRRSRGMYVSIRHKGKVAELLRNWPNVRFTYQGNRVTSASFSDSRKNLLNIRKTFKDIGQAFRQTCVHCAGRGTTILVRLPLG